MSGKINLKAMKRAAKRHVQHMPYPQGAADREEERERGRQQMRRNQELAAAASARESAKAREKMDAQRKEQAELEAAAAARRRAAARLLSSDPASADTPTTEVLAPPSRRARRPDHTHARPVWGGAYNLTWNKSFVQWRAELPAIVAEKAPPKEMTTDAFKNGLVIVRSPPADGLHTFGTRGLHPCPFARSGPWQEMASKLEVVLKEKSKKIAFVRAGGTGLEKLGAGTYNLVMRMRPGGGHFALPTWLAHIACSAMGRPVTQSDVALRITRNDCGDFPVLETIAGEVHNAIWASMNGIGPPLFAVAPLPAVREGRAARYAAVQVMQAAHCDLAKALERAARREDGVEIAIKIVELLWAASIRGVLFVDIKPGNILGFQTSRGLSFKLADTDPQFFLVLDPEERDWRALLLANLALLAAHVRNMEPASDATDAFRAAVRPVLVELLTRRGEYDSRWLFEARSVQVPFESPKDHGDFSLQRMICTMWSSYFLLKGYASFSWPRWDRAHQAALDEFWKRPANLTRWPPSWASLYRPLVQQLVEFATGPL
jgi:hypothetical protein